MPIYGSFNNAHQGGTSPVLDSVQEGVQDFVLGAAGQQIEQQKRKAQQQILLLGAAIIAAVYFMNRR